MRPTCTSPHSLWVCCNHRLCVPVTPSLRGVMHSRRSPNTYVVAPRSTGFRHTGQRSSTQPRTANTVNFGTGSLPPEQTKRHSESRDFSKIVALCFWGWKAATQTFGWQAVVIRQRKRKRLRAGGIIGHVTNQGEILGWQAGG